MNMTSKNSKRSDASSQNDSYLFRCTSARYDSIIDPNVPSTIRVFVPSKVIDSPMYSGPRFQFITGGTTQTTWFDKENANTLIKWLNKVKTIIETQNKYGSTSTHPLSSIIISGVKFVFTGKGEIVAHNKSGRVAISGYKTNTKRECVYNACNDIIRILSDFVKGVYTTCLNKSSSSTTAFIVSNPSDYYGLTYIKYSRLGEVPFLHVCSNSNNLLSVKFDKNNQTDTKCNLEHIEKLYESVCAMDSKYPVISPGSRYLSEHQGVIRYVSVINPPESNRWMLSISSDSLSFASKAVMTISSELLDNLKRILEAVLISIRQDINNE